MPSPINKIVLWISQTDSKHFLGTPGIYWARWLFWAKPRRHTIALATAPEYEGFEFGEFMPPDEFVIGLQANFVPGVDVDYLLKIAANITNETVVTSQNDAVSQQVGMRAGVHLSAPTGETLRSRLRLAPFRTFVEAVQPESDFIFRVKQTSPQSLPALALFEADGGKWAVAAMENIAAFLKALETGVQIIN